MTPIRIALAGNPNAGKTTVFNALTGENQHVGNWPGKTVKQVSGFFTHNGNEINVVDLPGAYSLSSYSPEEEIARDYIVWGNPDVVVNVVDASNLERNLYLTVQIMETNAPIILLVNMGDIAERRGVQVLCEKLSEKLGGIPIVPAVANKGLGLGELKQAIVNSYQGKNHQQ